MYKKIRLLTLRFLLFLLPSMASAQVIEIDMPHFAYMEYYLYLEQGARQDTIATGFLDVNATTIDLSAGHASYRGVAKLSIAVYARKRNIIINGNEHIRITEADEEEAETIFENSPENNFLYTAFARQNKIIQDYYKAANEAEKPLPFLVLAPPEQRLQALENDYKAFREEIANSPLYAARIVEILSYLSGVGSSFQKSQEEVLEEQRTFMTRKVDYDDLYTSGFWQSAFEVWTQLASANDSLLLSDARTMIDRCGDDIFIRREVTQMIVRQLSKYGRDDLLMELGTDYLMMPLNGQTAPEIIRTDGTSFLPVQSLIIFYETGCGNCHYELEQLKAKHKLLTDNNIRVISIAADIDKDIFENTAHSLPWTDKVYNPQGFESENFQRYGIIGTPTYILTDHEGVIRGRYAQLKELLKE